MKRVRQRDRETERQRERGSRPKRVFCLKSAEAKKLYLLRESNPELYIFVTTSAIAVII